MGALLFILLGWIIYNLHAPLWVWGLFAVAMVFDFLEFYDKQ